MIVLLVLTNCSIVDCQYALFVSSHQGYLFLSHCGILKHINSLQHILVLHFVQIQQHPLFYMILLLFYWDQHGAWQDQGFPPHHYKAFTLYNCLYELDSCTHYMGNYTNTTLSNLNYFFPCLAVFDLLTYLIAELTFLVLKMGFLLIFCTSLTLVLCLLLLPVAMRR